MSEKGSSSASAPKSHINDCRNGRVPAEGRARALYLAVCKARIQHKQVNICTYNQVHFLVGTSVLE